MPGISWDNIRDRAHQSQENPFDEVFTESSGEPYEVEVSGPSQGVSVEGVALDESSQIRPRGRPYPSDQEPPHFIHSSGDRNAQPRFNPEGVLTSRGGEAVVRGYNNEIIPLYINEHLAREGSEAVLRQLTRYNYRFDFRTQAWKLETDVLRRQPEYAKGRCDYVNVRVPHSPQNPARAWTEIVQEPPPILAIRLEYGTLRIDNGQWRRIWNRGPDQAKAYFLDLAIHSLNSLRYDRFDLENPSGDIFLSVV